MLVDNIGKDTSFSNLSSRDDTTSVTSLSNIASEYNICKPCGKGLKKLGLKFGLEKLVQHLGMTLYMLTL